jgi:hypothetical protein
MIHIPQLATSLSKAVCAQMANGRHVSVCTHNAKRLMPAAPNDVDLIKNSLQIAN